MHPTHERLIAQSTVEAETLLGIAQMQFAAFERLSALNFNAAKAVFEEGLAHARTLLDAQDGQQLVDMNVALARPSLEKTIAYWRSAYDVLAQSQGEIAKILENRACAISDETQTLLDSVSERRPAASGVPVALMKSALAAARSAYQTYNTISKEAGRLAEAGFAAAMEGVKASRGKPA